MARSTKQELRRQCHLSRLRQRSNTPRSPDAACKRVHLDRLTQQPRHLTSKPPCFMSTCRVLHEYLHECLQGWRAGSRQGVEQAWLERVRGLLALVQVQACIDVSRPAPAQC